MSTNIHLQVFVYVPCKHCTSQLHTSVRSLSFLHHLWPAALGGVNRIETSTSLCNLTCIHVPKATLIKCLGSFHTNDCDRSSVGLDLYAANSMLCILHHTIVLHINGKGSSTRLVLVSSKWPPCVEKKRKLPELTKEAFSVKSMF